ncbi:MAG: hypothetical protein ACOCP8_07285 [archaeon]
MGKAKKTHWNWKCNFCGHRNKEVFDFNFEIPQSYEAEWKCSKCGNINLIDITFKITDPEVKKYNFY